MEKSTPFIVNVTTLPPYSVAYPPDGDSIPPFIELNECLQFLRADLLRSAPLYLSFKAEPIERRMAVNYDWLLSFCDSDCRRAVREAFLERAQYAGDLVAAHVDIGQFEQFLGMVIDDRSLMMATRCLTEQDLRRQCEGRPGFVALLKHGMGLESVLPFVNMGIGMAEITSEKFLSAVGRAPQNDDLERCNCPDVGNIGHWYCGWCAQCDKPRFVCGHLLRSGERDSGQDK